MCEQTTFLCVVDPGVGSSRGAVAVRAKNGNVFVGPDNGLMWEAILRSSPGNSSGEVCAVRLPTDHVKSSTFHGRDVFSPTAAKIASGVDIRTLGTVVTLGSLTKLSFVSECAEGTESVGEVVTVDSFGNVITSAPSSLRGLASGTALSVTIGAGGDGGEMEMRFWATYAEAPEKELFVIEGSCSSLEVSVKNGDATKLLPGIALGTSVRFRLI